MALAAPPEERRARLERACGGDSELFEEAWRCLQWELRMAGFLRNPLTRQPGNERLFTPGQVLEDRFRILREVARGGMGVVYEAHDEKLDRRIAIKCAIPQFRKRLPPEARNATEISHPNVCKIFEIHTVAVAGQELEFLTMEYLDGETLSELLKRGPLAPKEARDIAAQICAGLAEAHRRKVIHGDLKTGNVIVTPEPGGGVRAVITDFGLARGPNPSGRITFASQAGGTPDYMAPELWRGEKASVASDIYALGKILEDLAFGDRETVEKPGRMPASLGRRWTRVIGRCVDPDPGQRFQSAEEVAEALRPRTRRRLLVLAAAVTLAAISGGLSQRIAKAPKESVWLGITPLASDLQTAEASSVVARDAAREITRLKGSARTRFSAIISSAGEQGAAKALTHVLRGRLESKQGQIVLNACVTDARTHVDAKCATAAYKPAEIRYAGWALAGLVTETFRLPAATEHARVSEAARRDYVEGVALLRRDSGVEKAFELLERAAQADPDSSLTHSALAEAEWWMYRRTKGRQWMERAKESVRQASLRNGDLAEAHRVAGLLQAEDGWYEQAALEYTRSIELDPANGDAHRRLGQVYQTNKQLDEALAEFYRAIEVDPANYRNYQALGSYHKARANYAEAARQFTKAVELAPNEPGAHYALGTAFLDLGRLADAEKEFRASLALGETGESLNALGVVLTYLERDADAIPFFSRAVGLSRGSFLWWINLGGAYRRIQRPLEARRANLRGLAAAETELERNPRNGYVRSCAAYLCAWLGQRRKAESEITQALRLSPHDSYTLWMAVHTYEAIGDREEAIAALNGASPEMLADVNRHPDLAALRGDPRFQRLIGSSLVR